MATAETQTTEKSKEPVPLDITEKEEIVEIGASEEPEKEGAPEEVIEESASEEATEQEQYKIRSKLFVGIRWTYYGRADTSRG